MAYYILQLIIPILRLSVTVATNNSDIPMCKDDTECEKVDLPSKCSSDEIRQRCPVSCDLCPKNYLVTSEMKELIVDITNPVGSKELQLNTMPLYHTSSTDPTYTQEVGIILPPDTECQDLVPECIGVISPCHHDAILQKHCPKACGTCFATEPLTEPDDVKCHDNPGCSVLKLPDDCKSTLDTWPVKHCLVSCNSCPPKQVSVVTGDIPTCKDHAECEKVDLPSKCSSDEIRQRCPVSCDLCPKNYIVTSELNEKIVDITNPIGSNELKPNTMSLYHTSSTDPTYTQEVGINLSPDSLIGQPPLSSNNRMTFVVICGFIAIIFVITIAFFFNRRKGIKPYHSGTDSSTSPVIDQSPLLTEYDTSLQSASTSLLSPTLMPAQVHNRNSSRNAEATMLLREVHALEEFKLEEISIQHGEPIGVYFDSENHVMRYMY